MRVMRIHAPQIIYEDKDGMKALAAMRNPDVEPSIADNGKAMVRLDCKFCWHSSWVDRPFVEKYHEATCPNCAATLTGLYVFPDTSKGWADKFNRVRLAYLN